jgi:membrane protein involved in colicin uptake
MTESTQVHGVEFKGCGCGCGTPISSSATYRPGHDARHAAKVGKAAAESGVDIQHPELYDTLPTAALRNKAQKIAVNLLSKAATKADKREARAKAKAERDLLKESRDAVAAVARANKQAAAKAKADAKRAEREAKAKAKVQADKARAAGDAARVRAAQERADAKVEDTGTVKVGRWDYPVRMTSAGKVQRNSKRDGSGSWETIDDSNAIVWAS